MARNLDDVVAALDRYLAEQIESATRLRAALRSRAGDDDISPEELERLQARADDRARALVAKRGGGV